jgi:hypothetical protein
MLYILDCATSSTAFRVKALDGFYMVVCEARE